MTTPIITNTKPSRGKGTLIINEFGNGFVNLATPSITVYIPKNQTARAYHLEPVEIEYTPCSHDSNSYSGKVINYSLVGKIMVGIVHHIYKAAVFIYIPELKLANLVQITTSVYLEKGNWVQIRITHDSPTLEPISQILGELQNLIPTDINQILAAKYNLTNLEEASTTNPDANPTPASIPNGFLGNLDIQERDQTHLDTMTIDPPNSLDCDDAFSVEFPTDTPNLAIIYVHIANVAYYFNPHTTPPALWNTIIARGTTYYGADGANWPMIPASYANGICSILPGKEEPTHVLTCEFHYEMQSRQLKFIGHYCSRVKSKAKLDYDTVDSILAAVDNSNPAIEVLLETSQVISDGYRDFILAPETHAHRLVRYWMIHVNTVMCRDIYRYNPTPELSKQETLIKYIKTRYLEFLIHQTPEAPKVLDRMSQTPAPSNEDTSLTSRDQLAGVINAHTDDALLMYLGKVSMQKSYYTSDPACNYHYGIGSKSYTHWTADVGYKPKGYTHWAEDVGYNPLGYTHWTSPIRRLPDLLNHCQLLGIVIPPETMSSYLEASNAAELKQDQIERFIITWKNASRLSAGSQVRGTIIGISRVGVAVYIYDLEAKYSIHISKLSSQRLEFDGECLASKDQSVRFNLFDTLQLRITKIFFDVIEFDVAS